MRMGFDAGAAGTVGLNKYPSCAAAWSTRCAVTARTPSRALSTRSTVAVDTPAARAMSGMRARAASMR